GFSGSTNASSGDPSTVIVAIYAGSSASGTPEQKLEGHRIGSSWSTSELRLTNGVYTVRAGEFDAAGNHGQSEPVTFTVNSSAPSVTLNKLPDYTNNTQPGFGGSADTSEAGPEVTLKIWRGTSASG